MPFIDEALVKLKAGNGGDGCMSFRREKYIPKGGPDGGDGGLGASIVLTCDENTTDLTPFVYEPEWNAPNGQDGMGAQRAGKDGKDMLLRVPEGTEVYDLVSGKKVAELLVHGEQVVLLKGGKGGLGNIHFKTSVNRAPRQTTNGKLGQEGKFRLELKCIADIGLVGLPNAGKSSLINQISHAQSKVAAYPFTTLNPRMGRMLVKGSGDKNKKIVIADIPGLIEGAHENRGLGVKFLKHLTRCKLLLFVIDISRFEGNDPLKDFNTLCAELEAYDPALMQKPRLVVANKIDLLPLVKEAAGKTSKTKKTPAKKTKDKKITGEKNELVFTVNKKPQEVFRISCQTGEGIEALKERLEELNLK